MLHITNTAAKNVEVCNGGVGYTRGNIRSLCHICSRIRKETFFKFHLVP